jgi:hypothetical protein
MSDYRWLRRRWRRLVAGSGFGVVPRHEGTARLTGTGIPLDTLRRLVRADVRRRI